MKRLPPPLWLIKIKANLFKTIYLNFKFFPWKIAKKFPIILVGKVNLGECKGKIVLKDPPHCAMVVIGSKNPPNISYKDTTFWVNGTLELSDYIRIMNGSCIVVSEGAVLSIGHQVMFNIFNNIRCRNRIQIGSYCRFAWGTQIFDSNFHYMVDENGVTKRHTGKTIIGDSCWIGNRVTINKGSVLPNHSIVATNSIVNKDFTQYGENITIGGIPAKFITNGYKRIVNVKKEKEIDLYFKTHPEEEAFEVGNDSSLFHWY